MSTTCEDCHLRNLGISAREIELLERVAQGYGNKEMAQQLGLSLRTIKNRLWHINTTLGTQDRTQAVLVAHALGLVDLTKLAVRCAKRLGHEAGR